MNKQKIRFVRGLAAALLAGALAGCGGGAETKTGSNGTGIAPAGPELGLASGAITGLGPLGLAGAQLDDGAAPVLINTASERSAAELRLGMTADASGTVTTVGSAGTATAAIAQSLVLGPLLRVDPGAGTLNVLGIAVRTDQNTLLEGVENLGQLVPGDSVEVYGLKQPGGATLATRLIVRRATAGADVEVLGTIGQIGAASFVTQGVQINLVNVQVGVATPGGVQFSAPPAGALSAGALVRVVGKYDPASGSVTATRIATGFAAGRPEGRLIYVEGFAGELGAASRFKIGDLDVDASGVSATVSEGARVRVRGRMQSGVLHADLITIIPPGTRTEYLVEGPVSAYTSLAAFVVRGERIDASQAAFTGGTAANLQDGRRVRVKGMAGPGKLIATEVAFIQ